MIERKEFKNGLTLELFDFSRRIAGDRWLVSFVARMEVAVKSEYFADYTLPDHQIKDICALLGEKVFFNYEKQRNFVADAQKEEVLARLRKSFLDTSLGYLSTPEFPKKFVLSKYKTKKTRAAEAIKH